MFIQYIKSNCLNYHISMFLYEFERNPKIKTESIYHIVQKLYRNDLYLILLPMVFDMLKFVNFFIYQLLWFLHFLYFIFTFQVKIMNQSLYLLLFGQFIDPYAKMVFEKNYRIIYLAQQFFSGASTQQNNHQKSQSYYSEG